MNSRTLPVILLILFAIAVLVAAPATATKTSEQSVSDSLTRGSRFTVTITGLPNTSYYVWLPRTFTMTGEPYDQPPVLSDYIENVRKDPAGGPYPIGLYQYNNGNGRTIRDDIAPSTTAMSNTNYYALVTTDAAGRTVVEFKTSLETGLRSYSVKVESPDSIDRDNLEVGMTVYSRKAPSIQIQTPDATRVPTMVTRVITMTPSMPPKAEVTTIVPTTAEETKLPFPTKKADANLFSGFFAILIITVYAGLKR
jgi:hypothetical protein